MEYPEEAQINNGGEQLILEGMTDLKKYDLSELDYLEGIELEVKSSQLDALLEELRIAKNELNIERQINAESTDHYRNLSEKFRRLYIDIHQEYVKSLNDNIVLNERIEELTRELTLMTNRGRVIKIGRLALQFSDR